MTPYTLESACRATQPLKPSFLSPHCLSSLFTLHSIAQECAVEVKGKGTMTTYTLEPASMAAAPTMPEAPARGGGRLALRTHSAATPRT